MDHPCVVTLDSGSAPRTLFSGDQLIDVDLPVGSRVIYPKPALAGLKDPDAAIRYALNHPESGDPLYAKLRPGMSVTIAVDDISLPLPPMRQPDNRQRIVEIVLALLADYGVDDVHIIIATGLHRRMKPREIRMMLGDRVYDGFAPDRLYNHDAEDRDQLVVVGQTESGAVIELNRRAAESDLLIYVNMTYVPMNGGYKSVAVGLTSYRTMRFHHNPDTIRRSDSYMDPKKSALAEDIAQMGRVVHEQLNIFNIESTVNNQMYDRSLGFLSKNEDELNSREKMLVRATVTATRRLPQPLRHSVFDKFPAPFEMTGVWAGDVEAVHEKAVARSFDQYMVPVEGQADVLICPIPYISPYNVHAFLNPLLVQVLAQGYLFNMYRGKPLVKKGGTLIITHPMTDRFDHEQHAPYVDFVHRVLPETNGDARKMRHHFEEQMAADPAYVQMFRTGHAYHPSHPFFMWYWGENGRQHIGKVIVVGADNEYIPKLFGYETAPSMDAALDRARGGSSRSQSVTCLHVPPIVMADVT